MLPANPIIIDVLHNYKKCDIQICNLFFSEIAMGTPCVVKMTSNQTILHPPPILSMSSENVKER